MAQGQRFKFGIGTTTLKGTVKVDTLLRALTFYVVKADTLFLLLLYNLDKIRVYYNNLTNQLVRKDITWPVVRKYGHLFLV